MHDETVRATRIQANVHPAWFWTRYIFILVFTTGLQIDTVIPICALEDAVFINLPG